MPPKDTRVYDTGRNERQAQSEWTRHAIAAIAGDFNRSADTHLVKLDLPHLSGVSIYLKDESTHPSGSLKHRLARSLVLYGLCNGWIGEGTVLVESSSGSTAISEAYFARLIGLPFIAVVPERTAAQKIAEIEFYGGQCKRVPAERIYAEASALAQVNGGHYMDQFTYAERATDWRGNNNIAQSMFSQMSNEPDPVPRWVVVSAGTGGTSSTIGRYIRYRAQQLQHTQLAVVDPENSVFYDYYRSGDAKLVSSHSSRIEGIGRPRVEPSFLPHVIDRMFRIPDAASLAAIVSLERLIGRKCGGSTGTNLYGAMILAQEMIERGEHGSILTLICDSGERYRDTYYNAAWLAEQDLILAPWQQQIDGFFATGRLDPIGA